MSRLALLAKSLNSLSIFSNESTFSVFERISVGKDNLCCWVLGLFLISLIVNSISLIFSLYLFMLSLLLYLLLFFNSSILSITKFESIKNKYSITLILDNMI